jgi:membrane-associated protease RseP (regulator of RpoE activity)
MSHLVPVADWLSVVVWGLVVHELGHIIAAEIFGMKVYEIVCSIRPWGIGVRHAAGTPIQNAMVALAGPTANLILFAAYLHHSDYNALGNLVFGVFNLVFPHSDGWKAVAYLRANRRTA